MELVSLQLVPEPFGSLDQAIDLMDKEVDGTFKFKVPDGKLSSCLPWSRYAVSSK